MSYYLENSPLHLNECLTFPLGARCNELTRLIDCGSIKDWHDFFPALVKSIFGYPGWGLRTITRETAPLEFEYVYNFFAPLGPIFRLCYRLLSEPMKFDVPAESLPPKMTQMLNNGRYSVFYSDILNIDPYRRQVASLQLNAFDYFMLHFALHGMLPLHKQYPAALTVHNDHLKTVYYFLTADYLCTFLPTDPNTVVLPSNVFCSVKTAAMVPMSPIVPMRTPKYLSSNAYSTNFSSNLPNSRTITEPSRLSCWRTESVLHFFIDTWLRYDVDGADLPSSEFIQVVRVLVKQLHSFANSVDLDVTPMAALRALVPAMMNVQVNNFSRQMLQRWPLDSSFLVVLELWLSYIQPWRYTLNKQAVIEEAAIAIPARFEKFIVENAASYTQTFIQLLPRFERLDFASVKNVSTLYRLAKVFSQSNLARLLRQHDRRLLSEHLTSSPNRSNLLHNLSAQSNQSSISGGNNAGSGAASPRTAQDVTDSFDPSATTYYSQRSTDVSFLQDDDAYVCLFGVTECQTPIATKLHQFTQKLFSSYETANRTVNQLEASVQQRYNGLVGYIKWYLANEEEEEHTQSIGDAQKIADILAFVVTAFGAIFAEELPTLMADFNEFQQTSRHSIPDSLLEETNSSDHLTLMQQSPRTMVAQNMLQRAKNIQLIGDPLTLPPQSNEIEFLVRFFYKLSQIINIKFGARIERHYRRTDFVGVLARQVFEAPKSINIFEKSYGISRLVERKLKARVNLRWIATYRTLFIVLLALLFGKLLCGGSFSGFLLMILFKVSLILMVALYDFLFN